MSTAPQIVGVHRERPMRFRAGKFGEEFYVLITVAFDNAGQEFTLTLLDSDVAEIVYETIIPGVLHPWPADHIYVVKAKSSTDPLFTANFLNSVPPKPFIFGSWIYPTAEHTIVPGGGDDGELFPVVGPEGTNPSSYYLFSSDINVANPGGVNPGPGLNGDYEFVLEKRFYDLADPTGSRTITLWSTSTTRDLVWNHFGSRLTILGDFFLVDSWNDVVGEPPLGNVIM